MKLALYEMNASITANLLPYLQELRLPPPRAAREFSTEQFIHDQIQRGAIVDRNGHRVLDQLCKRIEVIRKVQVGYNFSISKAIEREAVDERYCTALAGIYLLNFVATDGLSVEFKFLNCVLKMLGGTLVQPEVELPNAFGEMADHILVQIAGWLDAQRT